MKIDVIKNGALLVLLSLSLFFGSCSKDLLKSAEEEIEQGITTDESVMTLTLGLPDSQVNTRLQYTDASSQGRLEMITKWSADDKILVTLSPGNPETHGVSSILELQSGAGTSTGIFNGKSINYTSKNSENTMTLTQNSQYSSRITLS